MNDLKIDKLPDNTRKLFLDLLENESLSKLNPTLLGGTALTLKIGHRVSEDLDLFFFQDKLPKEVNHFIRELKNDYDVVSTLSQSSISTARINGTDLTEYIQEYNIDGVKVSFGVMGKGSLERREYFANTPKEKIGSINFLDLPLLFESKAVVLLDRVKSRDLYDLMVLVQDHNFKFEDIHQAIQKVEGVDKNKALTSHQILTGLIPIDKNDPGFESIGVDVEIEDIYKFFTKQEHDYAMKEIQSIMDNDVVKEKVQTYVDEHKDVTGLSPKN
jgi:hypothetical protein